jgi:GntR family transcriptional regulator, transcriptional repressor for pyruvate dehydrogenase complex
MTRLRDIPQSGMPPGWTGEGIGETVVVSESLIPMPSRVSTTRQARSSVVSTRQNIKSTQLRNAAPATQEPVFRPIQDARAFEEVARQIRRELAEGRLKVGSRLPPERIMAVQMGVSRHALREALRSLENAGLIRMRKGAAGGAFVADAGGNSIATGMLDLFHVGAITAKQLTQARLWIGGIVIREARVRATQSDINDLEANIEALATAITHGTHPERVELNLDFHRKLARIAANPILMIVTDGMMRIVADFVRSLGEYDSRFVLASRRAFMRSFIAGDIDAAVAEFEESINRLYRTYLRHARVLGRPQSLLRSAQSSVGNRHAREVE